MSTIKKHGYIAAFFSLVLPGILLSWFLWNMDKLKGLFTGLVAILTPVIIGCVVAFVLNIPMTFFENRVLDRLRRSRPGICRFLSITLSVLFIAGVLTILTLIISPEVKSTIKSISRTLPSAISNAYMQLQATLQEFGIDLAENPPFSASDITAYIEKIFSGAGIVISGAVGVASSLFSILFDLLLGICLGFFILAGKQKILLFCSRFARALLPEKTTNRLFKVLHLSNDCFKSFVTGQVCEAMILGVLCFIGMSIFGFPYAMTVAAVVSFTALIPIVGAWIGAGFGSLLILTVNPLRALLFLVFLIVLQQLEGNLIYPRVVGKSVGVPGVLVLLAITVGGNISGIYGMLLGVPVSAVLYTLAKEFIVRRESEKAALKEE